MNKNIVKKLPLIIVPIGVILLAGSYNIWLGVAAFFLFIALLLIMNRVFIYTILGSRRYTEGDMEQAIRWFEKAYKSKKASLNSSVSYAYLLLKTGKLAESEEILQQLLKKHAASHDANYIKSILALALWKKGDLDGATDMLETVIENYKTTSVYGSLGYLLILKGDLDKALQFNLEAHEYNSSDKIILDNLGQNYYLLGMYDKAQEIYEPLVEKAPSFPDPYYNYGLVLLKLGEREKALDIMKKAFNFKFTFLSSISREEIESKIQEVSIGV